MPNFYSFFLLLLFASTANAGPTIVITGEASQNEVKTELLGRYVPRSVVKNVDASKPNIVVYNREKQESLLEDTKHFQQLNGVNIDKNVSTIVFTEQSLEEMSYKEQEILDKIFRTERSLYVIVLGSDAPQNDLYWLDFADCWATSSVEIETPNTVYFCNKKSDELPFTLASKKIPIEKSELPPGISSVFSVNAASKKYKVDKKKMEEQLEDEIQDIVEETMKTVDKNKRDDDDDDDDDDDGDEYDNKHDPKRDNRLHCKYRKSCYETGKRGLIEKFDLSFDHLFHFWRAPPSQQHHLPKTEDADQDGIPDSEDDDVDLADRKLVCKYRTECYKQHNIPLSDKQQERERSFMSAKLQAPQGKKRTLKDIAQKAVSGVKEREEEVKTRPVPKSLIVEKKLQAIEDQLQKKLDCKYRKSCYETGELPEIEESSFKIPFLSEESEKNKDDDDDDEKPFEEMEDLEKKHYCKYRKSCYETGEKPDIESEIVVESFRDILEVPDLVETRKLSLQERCKYRKSCYETGVLPDFSRDDEHIEKIAKKEVSSVIPSTVQDLKTLCKYRKSCYQEISDAPSADIIQTIRKRRLIEKEVRKRRTRRHRRLHKRRAMMSRYGMTSAPSIKYEKVEKTQKELQDIADAREHRKDTPAPKSVKIQGKKKEKAAKIVEEVVAQKIIEKVSAQADEDDDEEKHEPEPVKKTKKSLKKVKEPEPEPEVPEEQTKSEREPEPVEKSKRSLKRIKKPVPEPEEETEEPEVIPVSVPVPVQSKKSKKSHKKVREPEPEPEDEKDPDEEREDEPEPVIETKKSSKKEAQQKQVPVQEPPVKVEKIINKEAEKKKNDDDDDDDDDDDGNEFDNAHDPKRDHRLHCKYRKTCYETGERGLIEPFDFSIWHIFHFWAVPASQQHHNYGGKYKDSDGDGTPDIEDKDALMADRKLSCKYRPSCYKKYDIPVAEKILEREQQRTEESDSTETDDEDEYEKKVDLNAADRRLECKYRRSCYDSGVLPTIQQWSDAPTLSETIEISSKEMKMTKCKYRKSCYEAAGITDKEVDDVIEKEEKPHLKETLKPAETERHHHTHSKHHGKKKHQVPEDSDEDKDDDDDDDETDDKQKKPKEEKKAEAESHKQTDQETIDKELHLSVAEKSYCKYRKSCYSSVEPKAAKQDHSGTMARREGSGKKCHIYYLSCREAMGLPPKEKAPMGPNGKRLCRKVKKE